jgi:cell division protein FtsN
MKKKHIGATKKKPANPIIIPWQALGILGSVLVIAGLVTWSYPYLQAFYAKQHSQPVVKALAPEQTEPAVFEFYSELTKQEADEYSRRAKSSPNNSLKKTQPPSYKCYVQAGSFAHLTDAERTRAFLTLNGYAASVKSVTLEDGRTRHRVILGPFISINEAEDMQKNLYSFAGIQSILLKSA